MKELIQYLQTLPIGPLAWIVVSASAVAIVFVCVIFYQLLFRDN